MTNPENRPAHSPAPAPRSADENAGTAKKKMDPIKKKHKRVNNLMVLLLLVVSIVTVAAFAYNIYKVMAGSKSTGSGETLATDTGKSMKNDQYTIGNNPTEIEQTYFQELTDAVNSQDKAKIASAVVKCFVADYFTWTNKDGNYEIGGLQYVYGQKTGALETYSRWNFYEDLDLYISQYGRENLLQVKSVDAGEAGPTDDFEVKTTDPQATLKCYYVEATWTYEDSSKIDVSSFMHSGAFYIVDDNGRMEIAQFYDLES